MQDIDIEVRNIVAEIVEKSPEDIKPESRFVEDLGMDSMMALEILAAIEKKYKISIPEEKLAEFKTLNDTLNVVKENLCKKDNNA
ncbi:MAG: acyl carrier protein [Candidatus Omnitrophota bacterium]|jgi:acyl carrier protein